MTAPISQRNRIGIALSLALSGGAVATSIGLEAFRLVLVDMLPFVFCAFLGAGSAGAITAPLFGRPGKDGALSGVFGGIIATGLGAAFGGFLFGAMVIADSGWSLGLFYDVLSFSVLSVLLVFQVLVSWASGPLWLIAMALVHLAARRLRETQ